MYFKSTLFNKKHEIITEKPPVDPMNKSPNSGPSIMKKRGYEHEHSNGIDNGDLGRSY